GSYQGGVGDYRTLTLTGGVYTLTEPDGDVVAFDSHGRLAYTQDRDGDRVTAGYTDGEMTSLADSDGEALTLAHNSAGRISRLTDSVGRVTTYVYDATSRYLMSVTGPQGTTSYTYVTGQGIAEQNALASITFPGGTHQYFRYDAQGRLIEQSQ